MCGGYETRTRKAAYVCMFRFPQRLHHRSSVEDAALCFLSGWQTGRDAASHLGVGAAPHCNKVCNYLFSKSENTGGRVPTVAEKYRSGKMWKDIEPQTHIHAVTQVPVRVPGTRRDVLNTYFLLSGTLRTDALLEGPDSCCPLYYCTTATVKNASGCTRRGQWRKSQFWGGDMAKNVTNAVWNAAYWTCNDETMSKYLSLTIWVKTAPSLPCVTTNGFGCSSLMLD